MSCDKCNKPNPPVNYKNKNYCNWYCAKKKKRSLMSYVYQWKVSNGDEVFVEYCWSSMDKCIKVVEMKVNGKYHRINWMSKEGREELMGLLEEDYNMNIRAMEMAIL